MNPRIFRTLLLVLLFVFFIAGCAKKTVPEPVPDPMTEAYLLKHMRVQYDAHQHYLEIAPPALTRLSPIGDNTMTLQTTLSAQVPLSDSNQSRTDQSRYLLIFSTKAPRWLAFSRAIDTNGNRYSLVPFTSHIRKGVYYENFSMELNAAWIAHAAQKESELLLLGQSHESTFKLPLVYPAALRRYLIELQKKENP